jgi:hypothetical protein
MNRTHSPLALLLAATLLVPGEVHVVTGRCSTGLHSAAGAMSEAQAQHPASHPTTSCATHHPGQYPASGGAQHCTAPGACAAGVALLESFPLWREGQAEFAAQALFSATPNSHVAPPGTPPPRQ